MEGVASWLPEACSLYNGPDKRLWLGEEGSGPNARAQQRPCRGLKMSFSLLIRSLAGVHFVNRACV